MYELHMHKFDEDSLSNDDGVRFDDNKSENDSDVGCEDGAEEQHGSLHEEKRISYLTGDEIKGLHWESEDSLRNRKHFMRVDRKRDRRLITRTNCEAKLRVYLDYKTSRWKVYSLRETHNHELTPPTDIRHIPKYNVMTDLDKSQVDDSLHKFGVRTCHIMGCLMAQKDRYDGVGFS
ncbi:hypothetical protein JHK87_027574 [Glycine soja]|nr:hypothetical protein JHK87_027574 [Glycine soja]